MKYLLFKNQNAFALRTLAFLCALAIVAVGHAPMALAEANWVQTYYNGAHTGYNPSEKTLGVSNVPSLQLLWATSVAGGVTNFAVDDGVLYATGQADNLVALNATTGAQLWSANTGGNGGENGSGSIAVGGGLVYVQCTLTEQGGGQYGGICAYKAKTGKIAWTFAHPCNCLPEAAIESPLVYSGGNLYFGFASGGTTSTRGIYALKASTGAQLWDYAEYSNSFADGPAAVQGSYVFSEAGPGQNIVALSTANGGVAWSAPTSENNAEISVSGGVVYVSTAWNETDATLYALKETTGDQLWAYTYAGQNWFGGAEAPSPAAIANGIVYFQGVDGNLYALKAKTGKLVWADTPTDSGYNRFTTSPSIANGVLYISGGNDMGTQPNTSAYNAATGAFLWASPSPHGTLLMPPVVVNGVLYFASPGDSICESICAYSLP
jgi:outer membrane protein assembly factor BamB